MRGSSSLGKGKMESITCSDKARWEKEHPLHSNDLVVLKVMLSRIEEPPPPKNPPPPRKKDQRKFLGMRLVGVSEAEFSCTPERLYLSCRVTSSKMLVRAEEKSLSPQQKIEPIQNKELPRRVTRKRGQRSVIPVGTELCIKQRGRTWRLRNAFATVKPRWKVEREWMTK